MASSQLSAKHCTLQILHLYIFVSKFPRCSCVMSCVPLGALALVISGLVQSKGPGVAVYNQINGSIETAQRRYHPMPIGLIKVSFVVFGSSKLVSRQDFAGHGRNSYMIQTFLIVLLFNTKVTGTEVVASKIFRCFFRTKLCRLPQTFQCLL